MKKAVLFLILMGLFFKINAQKNFWDLTDAQLKTNMQRVNSQGSIPPQTRFNFYSDKMNKFFIDNLWKGDNILSIKELRVSPPDDPSDWYYFVSIKTKLCTTPFYCNYDIGDRVLGELFMWDTRILPKEIIKHVDSINAKIDADKKAAAEKERVEEEKMIENQKITKEKERIEEEKMIENQKITNERQLLRDHNRIDSLMNQKGLTKIKDIDGNEYRILTYGEFNWMIDNLKATKYNDGTAIPNITDNTAWAAATAGAYSDYDNTPANSTIYGRLYNWYVVDNNAATKVASNGGKNVCPTSWHVPTDAEWTTLTTYLGESVAGGKLKETGTIHWLSPNTGATNETGFTALPGGNRNFNGTYFSVGNYGSWWSSTETSTPNAWNRNMTLSSTDVSRGDANKQFGFSVRCVKDH